VIEPAASAGQPAWRRWLPWLLKGAVVAALAVWLLRGDDAATLWDAARRLPLTAMGGSLVLALGLMWVGAVRWGMLMRAFGATGVPGNLTLLRLILVGLFYNTFVPGAIGGDIVRGALSRRLFDNKATPYVVVLLERLIGLSALGMVFVFGVLVGPDLFDLSNIWPWIAALVAGGALLFAIAWNTDRFGSLFKKIPAVHHPKSLQGAAAISFVGHAFSVAIFWVLVWGLGLPVDVTVLLQVVPLGLLAAVIPLAIVGIGPRELALVGLLGLHGIAKGDALALSLGYAATIIVLAGVGGLLQLFGPQQLHADATSASDTTRSSAEVPRPG
jgi:uncharacterized membrane protein YbhN (UPF0104 family)